MKRCRRLRCHPTTKYFCDDVHQRSIGSTFYPAVRKYWCSDVLYSWEYSRVLCRLSHFTARSNELYKPKLLATKCCRGTMQGNPSRVYVSYCLHSTMLHTVVHCTLYIIVLYFGVYYKVLERENLPNTLLQKKTFEAIVTEAVQAQGIRALNILTVDIFCTKDFSAKCFRGNEETNSGTRLQGTIEAMWKKR